MAEYRQSAHAVFDLKYHMIWCTKYRKKVLRERVAERARDLIRQICAARTIGTFEKACRFLPESDHGEGQKEKARLHAGVSNPLGYPFFAERKRISAVGRQLTGSGDFERMKLVPVCTRCPFATFPAPIWGHLNVQGDKSKMPYYCADHQRFVDEKKKGNLRSGQRLSRREIIAIVQKANPNLQPTSFHPSDHNDQGNLGECACNGTDDRIFDMRGYDDYLVR